MPETATAKTNGRGHHVQAADLEDQIARLRDDLVELTRTVTDLGSYKVEKTTAGIAHTSAEAIEGVREEVSSIENDIRASVRDNPLQAIGIAAGIGFIAALLSRK